MWTKKFIIAPLIFLCLSCNRNTPRHSIQKSLAGLSGEAVYSFTDQGEVWSVYKNEYTTECFFVTMDKDTIQIGEDFKGLINLSKGNTKAIVKSPSSSLFISDSLNKGLFGYSFSPTSPGIYDFNGTIELDSMSIPFAYKFIAIGK